MIEQTKKLFPSRQETVWDETQVKEIKLFDIQKPRNALKKIKTKKAPGLDGILPEMAKVVAETEEKKCLQVFNNLWKSGAFPERWKSRQLVLIEKPRKNPEGETLYRPICLINYLGKLYEKLINKRFTEEQ